MNLLMCQTEHKACNPCKPCKTCKFHALLPHLRICCQLLLPQPLPPPPLLLHSPARLPRLRQPLRRLQPFLQAQNTHTHTHTHTHKHTLRLRLSRLLNPRGCLWECRKYEFRRFFFVGDFVFWGVSLDTGGNSAGFASGCVLVFNIART
jgi:hypothetical protein